MSGLNCFYNELCEGYEDSANTVHWLKIHDICVVVWIDRFWPFDRFCYHSSQELCQLSDEHTLCSMCEQFSLISNSKLNQIKKKKLVFCSSLRHSKSSFLCVWVFIIHPRVSWIYSKNLRIKYARKYIHLLCKSNNFYYCCSACVCVCVCIKLKALEFGW